MHIRDANPADAPAIGDIGTTEFVRLHAPLMGAAAAQSIVDQIYTGEAVIDSISRCRSSADAHFLVAEREERVVGYLHFDSFGADPELHRIYLDRGEIGRGTGTALMDELHARLGPDGTYILIVAAANEQARRFYERHGLVEEREIANGNALYADNMRVEFPPDTPLVPALVLRWRGVHVS